MPEHQTAEKSLGLTGITSNARTLLAPAASAWILLSTQCVTGTAAADIFCGVLLALAISIAAALAHSRLAASVPATGPAYFYVLQAFAARTGAPGPLRLLLLAASYLYYFLYPALIFAATTLLATYLTTQFFPIVNALPFALVFCVVFAMFITFVASRGVAGSSQIHTVINILQITLLLLFSFIAIVYRLRNSLDPIPITENHQYFRDAADILRPHALSSILLQAALALGLFTGFESTATATPRFSARIRRTLLVVLLVQGVFCYLFQYFAIEYAFTPKFGIVDASHSLAPLADMTQIIAVPFFGTISGAWWFMFLQAAIVFLALVGIALSALTNASRVAYALKPARSPLRAIRILGTLSAVIAALAVGIYAPAGLFILFLLCGTGILLLFLAIALASLRQK